MRNSWLASWLKADSDVSSRNSSRNWDGRRTTSVVLPNDRRTTEVTSEVITEVITEVVPRTFVGRPPSDRARSEVTSEVIPEVIAEVIPEAVPRSSTERPR